MNMQSEKMQMIRRIMDTEDKSIINELKAFFQTRPSDGVWFDNLPDDVKDSVERGLKESANGEGIPHSVVKSKYKKWLSK